MKKDSVIVTIAVVAVLASFVGLLMNYGSLSDFNNLFTGFATENGTVNVTISSITSVTIFSANGTEGNTALNWGTGSFTTAGQPAYLISNGTLVNSNGWDQVDEGFIIQNNGNVDVNLNLSSSDNATNFIGGTDPLFQFNLTNNETGSCTNQTVRGVYDGNDFSETEISLCEPLESDGTTDSIRLDVLLRIPADASGTKGTIVVLSYEAVS